MGAIYIKLPMLCLKMDYPITCYRSLVSYVKFFAHVICFHEKDLVVVFEVLEECAARGQVCSRLEVPPGYKAK